MVDENLKKCPDCPETCPRRADTCHVFCKIYKGWSGRQAKARNVVADDYCVSQYLQDKEKWRKNHANR